MKSIKKFFVLAFALCASSIPLGRSPFTMAKAEEEGNRIWLNTEEDVIEGYSYSADLCMHVYEEVSALSVEVHFNPSVVSIGDTYNNISAQIYDYSINEESVNYTYIFDHVDLDSNQTLFYFGYNVLSGVAPGRYYFDIVISEAYNSSLESVEISTTRKYIDVKSQSSLKVANAYPSESNVNTSYNQEFTFTYYLDSSEPSSGAFVIRYDDKLFEFVSLTKLDFFDNMICDYNASAKGEIIVTFIEVTRDYNTSLFEITLKTINNVDASSQITFAASELYDTDMNPMRLNATSISVDVAHDPSYEEHPSMTTSYQVNAVNHQVVFTINLEEDSHLGAGDFIFRFDKDIITYVESTKLINPTMFTINDKQAQLDQGQIKFSILSTTDIVEANDILRITFSYSDNRNDRNSSITLIGNGLTDSLTNPIQLDISGTDYVIPGVDLVLLWIDTYMYMDDPSFIGDGSGRCISDGLYETAKRELLKLDEQSINDFKTNADNKYTDALMRYEAWAKANHDENPFTSNYDFLNASSYSGLSIDQNSDMIDVYIIIAFVSILSIGFFALIRKKKRQ